MNEQTIYTITQLNQSAKKILETQLGLVWLTGEISNFTQPVSGHWYLTLKDQNSQVRCAMFRMKNSRVTFQPQNGMQVLVRANVSLYEPRGDYQLIIESMQTAGEGLLQQKFDALKMKLASEGLFAQNLKKKLPPFTKRVGVVTSKTGAALQDILNVLNRRDPSLEVVIYPSAVQGKEATIEIAQMIELANQRKEVDVLIIGRGGGTLEDLWCFNEEVVARAIFKSTLPIISAVGHEIDITIADFVADIRAPTPSAAAELVSRNKNELLQQITRYQQRLEMALDRIFYEKTQYLKQLQLHLQNHHPLNYLASQKQYMQQLNYRLNASIKYIFYEKTQCLKQLQLHLQNHHPLNYLASQKQYIQQLNYRLNVSIKYIFDKKRHRLMIANEKIFKNPLLYHFQKDKHDLNSLTQRLHRIPLPYLIQKEKQNLFGIQEILKQIIVDKIKFQKYQFLNTCTKLDGLSPLKILSRGYSISETSNGKTIVNISQINVGEVIKIRVNNGIIISEVKQVETK